MTTTNSTFWFRYTQIPDHVIERESKIRKISSDSPGENAYGSSLNDNVVKANFAKGSSQGKQTSQSLLANTNAITNLTGPQLLRPLARPKNKKVSFFKGNRAELNELQTPATGF